MAHRDAAGGRPHIIPGINGTMRVNGRAELSTDPALCAPFAMEGKIPKCVIVVYVERAYTQCQKALVRGRIWDASTHIAASDLPSTGEMMQRLAKDGFDGKAYDTAYPERMKATIY
jgi:uncharacterized protein